MIIGNFQSPNRTDSPDVPDNARWIDGMLAPRDRQVKDMTQALQKNLSREENLRFERRAVTMSHLLPLELTVGFKGAIQAVTLDDTGDHFAMLRWKRLDQGRVEVTVSFSVDPGEPVPVVLGIWGG